MGGVLRCVVLIFLFRVECMDIRRVCKFITRQMFLMIRKKKIENDTHMEVIIMFYCWTYLRNLSSTKSHTIIS